jgi:hypothetical protein
MSENTDQEGPQPYGPDQLVQEISDLLTAHGFQPVAKAVSAAEVRYHAAALLHLLLGGSPWESPPGQADS